MIHKIKYFLVGSPLPTEQLFEKRPNKIRALAAFSPGAISSIAYANQEIYLGLIVTGSAGLVLEFPLALVITALLAIVALSYSQTIRAYPNGGGSYIVARENLGTLAGLVAAAALMVDYILTAAVSLTAGVEAIASAFPALWPYKIEVSLVILLVITLANLRGQREAGTLMSVPVYLFLGVYLTMLFVGIVQWILYGTVPLSQLNLPSVKPLSTFIVLHAFSTGCTALTGIEAISNGVPSFKSPEIRNARITLVIMAFLMGILFLASIGLTQFMGVVSAQDETILSALAHKILGNGFAYFVVQIVTLSILAVAANTSFAGFPRVAALLANDGFLPRQLSALGDRLVFNNGILLLSIATVGLIVVFRGNSHALVPLFAIGAFLAFTLSQAGMVIHWLRSQTKNKGWSVFINGLGALVTGIAVILISVSKFLDGAWISILAIPLIVFVFFQIRSHFKHVAAQLTLRGLPPSLKPSPITRVVVPISDIHRGIVEAINFARAIAPNVTALYVELEPESGLKMEEKWHQWWPDIPLAIIPSPYRSIVGPILNYLDEIDRKYNDGQQAIIVLPEFLPAKIWQGMLHNNTARMIKNALLYQRRERGFQRVIIDVPFHLRE